MVTRRLTGTFSCHYEMGSGGVVARIQISLLHFFKISYVSKPKKGELSLDPCVLPLSTFCETVERAQKEAAEKEQELLRQKQKELQQVMESQERSYKENIVQLHEKMETERKNILEKQEEMLAHKLKVQEEMLNEGFKSKYEAMDSEISQLQKQIQQNKEQNSSLAAQIFDGFGNVLMSVLPGTGKLFGLGLKILSRKMK